MTKPSKATKATKAADVVPTPANPVLLISVAPATPRPNTASAACYAVLVANVGQPYQTVLAALTAAEKVWHTEGNRSVKGINPAGWTKKYNAVFAA